MRLSRGGVHRAEGQPVKGKVVKVRVTQECIDAGVQSSDSECALALAISEQFESACVSVGPRRAWMRTEMRTEAVSVINYIDYKLPRRTQQFVRDFDAGEPVKPTTLELREIL